jgi:hypothetical protein
VVTADPLYQVPDRAINQTILEFFAIKGPQTVRTFDLIRTNHPAPALTGENLEEYLPRIRLCGIKSTKAPIKNTALNGFFFVPRILNTIWHEPWRSLPVPIRCTQLGQRIRSPVLRAVDTGSGRESHASETDPVPSQLPVEHGAR